MLFVYYSIGGLWLMPCGMRAARKSIHSVNHQMYAMLRIHDNLLSEPGETLSFFMICTYFYISCTGKKATMLPPQRPPSLALITSHTLSL